MALKRLFLALLIAAASFGRVDAAVAVVNTTACVSADKAAEVIDCPLSAQPTAGNVLVAAVAATGGACAVYVVGFTVIGASSSSACYQAAYFVVGSDTKGDVTIINKAGAPTVAAVIVELSGTAQKGALVDNVRMWTELTSGTACVTSPAALPAQPNDGAFAFAMNVTSKASLTGYATTPDTADPAGFSASATGAVPLRVDVGFSVYPGSDQVFGTFNYSGDSQTACGIVLFNPSGK